MFYPTTYKGQLVFISKIATGVCIMKKMMFHIQYVLLYMVVMVLNRIYLHKSRVEDCATELLQVKEFYFHDI